MGPDILYRKEESDNSLIQRHDDLVLLAAAQIKK
jgi:hypothetical protein